MSHRLAVVACFLFVSLAPALGFAAPSASTCIDCHSKKTPNIVSDWKLSKHSGVDVTCVTCHGDGHNSDTDVSKVRIPTPDTCEQCHAAQVAQFKKGKHAAAWAAMKAMPTIHWQPMAMTEGEKGCGGCHKIGLKSLMDIVDLRVGRGSRDDLASSRRSGSARQADLTRRDGQSRRPRSPYARRLAARA